VIALFCRECAKICKKVRISKLHFFCSSKIAHFQNVQLPTLLVGQSHIYSSHIFLFSKVKLCHPTFCLSFQKSNCAFHVLLLFSKVPLWDRTFLLLFSKVQSCNHTFYRSFQKCDKKSNRTIALSNRANVQKCAKKCEFLITFFRSLKRAIALGLIFCWYYFFSLYTEL